jgi:nitrous oxidase accessory protein
VTTPNKLSRIPIFLLLIALLTIPILGTLSLNIQMGHANSKNLIVPDNFPTINNAIGNASQGDTILVRKGVYYENPTVDKPLTIIAQEQGQTIIIGAGGLERGAKPVFKLAANNINLKGFTIKSQNYSSQTNYATGVLVAGDSCTLTDNNIVGTYYGIFASVQTATFISNNNITNTLKDGIRICGGSTNTVADNRISKNAQSGIAIDGYMDTIAGNLLFGNYRGIGLGASYSTVYNNSLSKNSESGLYIAASDSLIVSNNIMQSKWGIYFTSYFAAPNNNTFYNNNFTNNTQQVGTSSTYNTQLWDNGSKGNYWSNYNKTTTSNNGIGNSPFTVYGNDSDRYPLTAPYHSTENAIQPDLPNPKTATNGTISHWLFDTIEPNGVTPDSLNNNPVILETSGGTKYTPILVNGKVGNALSFNGTDYAYVTSSPTMNIQSEFTIKAWVKVQEFKNVTYNNIIVECIRTPDKFPTRIFGFAINGESPENNSSPPLGALRGFLLDDKGTFNEIVTTEPVVPLNQWIHVEFTRSLSNGMHISVDDTEKNVKVTSGDQNPQGLIAKGTEYYIGHDSQSTIDEMSITSKPNTLKTQQTSLLAEWWFWATIIAGTAFIAAIALFLKQNRKP